MKSSIGTIEHVVEKEKPFEDAYLFFTFSELSKQKDDELKLTLKSNFDTLIDKNTEVKKKKFLI